jgi:hypothetical protein
MQKVKYWFNFSQNVAVTEVLEVLKQPTDTCEILGRVENRSVSLLDPLDPKKGIIVNYAGGDKCTNGDNPALNGQPRQTRFKLECSDRQDDVNNYFKNSSLLTYQATPKVLQNVSSNSEPNPPQVAQAVLSVPVDPQPSFSG